MTDAFARLPTQLPPMTAPLLRALWKERRDSYAQAHLYEDVRIRVHRSLTWMERAESRAGDEADTALIEWWAALSALFTRLSAVTGQPLAEREAAASFARQLFSWDRDGALGSVLARLQEHALLIWQDPYLTRALGAALSGSTVETLPTDPAVMLGGLLERVGLSVRQLTIGAAAYGGSQNRQSVERSTRVLAVFLPAALEVITEHGYIDDWGALCSPPR